MENIIWFSEAWSDKIHQLTPSHPLYMKRYWSEKFDEIRADEAEEYANDCYIEIDGCKVKGWRRTPPVTHKITIEIRSFDNSIHPLKHNITDVIKDHIKYEPKYIVDYKINYEGPGK